MSMTSNNSSSPYMTVAQAAFELDVARKTVYGWIKSGLLRAGKLPTCNEIRLRRNDWDAFVASMFGENIGGANDDGNADTAPISNAGPVVEQPQARRTQPRDGNGRRDFFTIGNDIGATTSGAAPSPIR